MALVLTLAPRDASAEEKDVSATCATCHGTEGLSKTSANPNIAGHDVEMIEDALRAYRDGSRKCGKVPMMCKAASKLTDQQIESLAHNYADKPYKAAEQPFDAALAAKGQMLHDKNCKGCHGTGPKDADSGPLHGQWADYLRYALGQYGSGGRVPDPMMKAKLTKLSPADIDALVNYYASYR
jgi:sulfide dehydrogenase cytochrome subunit